MYKGDNIHAYTSDIERVLESIFESKWTSPFSEYRILLSELEQHYPNKPAILNIKSQVRDDCLFDPELVQGTINILFLLGELWCFAKNNNEFRTFETMLDEISSTCIQGISHRVIMNYVAIIIPTTIPQKSSSLQP